MAQFTQLNIDPRAVIHQQQLEPFAQNEWRVRHNLTLTYGVRYSLFFQPTDAKYRRTYFPNSIFGQAYSARDARILQLGLKVTF